MKIYFVRHGQTDWNNQGKIQGKTDTELNKTGIEQAKEASEKLKDADIDIIICSPLKRARKTAEIINEKLNVDILHEKEFSERDYGEFEGISKYDLNTEEFWDYDKNVKYKKAESVKDLFDRVYRTLDKIIEKYKGKNILIVAHSGISIPFKCYFKKKIYKNNLNDIRTKNGEVISFDIKDYTI